MAYNNNGDNGGTPIPTWMINNAKKRLGHVQAEFKQAKIRIPAEYHDFLVLFPQNEKIGEGNYSYSREAGELGLFVNKKGGVYLPIEKPYLTVDGRVKMLRDEHEKAGKKFKIHPPIIQVIDEFSVMMVRIESELYGEATGMIEIGKGGYGADAKNPFANAQTSAIGRALGFLGYGNIGTAVIGDEAPLNGSETPSNASDKTQTSNNQPSANTTPKNEPASNKPIQHRIQVTTAVQFNPDGSSTFTAKTIEQNLIQVVLKAPQQEFAKQLYVNAVINVTGWYNVNNKRLVVADNSPSAIEPAV